MTEHEKIRLGLALAVMLANEKNRPAVEAATAALATIEARAREPVAAYLVATGETYEGAETYTRHDVAPALCDCEKLYTAPALPNYDPLGFAYEWEYCGNWFPDFSRTRPIDSPHRRNITPLYAAPPLQAQRDPSDDECARIADDYHETVLGNHLGAAMGRAMWQAVKKWQEGLK